jgi:hypothetical protein
MSLRRNKLFLGILIVGALALFVFATNKSRINSFAISQVSSNLEVDIPSDYKQVAAGDKIWFTTKLLNLADVGRRDVTLTYKVTDNKQNVLVSKSETVAVQTQASFVGSLEIPQNAPTGDYILSVFLNSVGESRGIETQSSFRIVKNATDKKPYYYIGGGIIALVIIILLGLRGKSLLGRIRIRRKIHRIVRKRLN